MAASPRRTITVDLLAVSVRIKQEAGVTHDQIQAVIDRYASREEWEERTGGIGFPLVEDVPQDQRAGFLAALSELMPEPERREALSGMGRTLLASEIWPSRTF